MASSEPILEVERSESFTDVLVHGLWEMKSRGEMTDFNIKINNDVIPCHRNVMATVSPYFKRLLQTPMKESQNREVELALDAVYVPKVVDYCYTGKITIGLSEAEVCLDIAEYLELNALKTNIEDFVCKHLSTNICIGWYFLADKYNLDTLKKNSKSMMISDFQHVVKHIEFHELTLTELIDYIQQVVIISDADAVLDACVIWVTCNAGLRSESFLDILKHLRLDRCSQACIEKVRKSWHPVWPNYAEIQKVLDVQCSNTLEAPIATEASTKLKIVLLGGFTGTRELNRKVWKIDLANGKCDEIGEMAHYAVKYHSAYCPTVRGLIIIGGSYAIKTEAPTTHCSLLTVPDMQCDKWPKVGHTIAYTDAVCIKNHIYNFGDYDNDKFVSCLDLTTKTWSSSPDMPVGNANPIIAAIQEKVYMIFHTITYNDKFRTSDEVPMYCFDTSTHSWSELNPLYGSLKNTEDAKAVAVGEELFLVGGKDRLCAKYLPKNKKWTLLRKPKLVNRAFSAVYMQGQVVLFGGCDEDETNHKNIEVYDIAKNTWKVHQLQMPLDLTCHHCAVYDEATSGFVL